MKPKPTKLITISYTDEHGETVERSQLSYQEDHRLTGVAISQFRSLAKAGEFNPITGFGNKHYISAEDFLKLSNHRLRNHKPSAPPAEEPTLGAAPETVRGWHLGDPPPGECGDWINGFAGHAHNCQPK